MPLYQVPFAEEIRREVGIPTIAVGQIWEPRQAEDVLQRGWADLIAIARRMLYNPRWAWHAAAEFNEFIPYPPRYKSCNPIMATASIFAESKDKSSALREISAAEAEFARRDSART